MAYAPQAMIEDSSDFFSPSETDSKVDLATLRLIHHSEGGYCDIFRIDRTGRFRVLKCLRPEYRGNPLYENLLRKEFEIGYSLRHPGIVEYYGYSAVDGLGNCIEMDWVDGCTLAEAIENGQLSAAQEDKVLDEICDALSYLHSRQVVHRDLKPSNIMLTHSGNNVRIIDFGFSDSDTHSILKTAAGTVNYTAPEVLAGGKADARSDIYSLGLIIYAVSKRHRLVARKCCEKRPYNRYASAAQVKKALHGRSSLLAGVLLVLLLAAFTLYPYVERIIRPGQEPLPAADSIQSATSPADTSSSLLPAVDSAPDSAPTPASSNNAPKKAPSQPEEDIQVDASDIDAIFRQATELFD